MGKLFKEGRRSGHAAIALLSLMAVSATAQTPTESAAGAAGTPAARAAIANRKAVFTLIGNNFRPIAEVLRAGSGAKPLDTGKYAARIATLADFLPDAFPDVSNGGDTRARAEIWSNRADFEKKLQEFHEHTAQLLQAASRHDEEAFKTSGWAVAQDCKGCHEHYRSE